VNRALAVAKTDSSFRVDCICMNRTFLTLFHLRRFEEKCTRMEEEDCKTVYDNVLEKKCEMVNVTVPQTECEESTDIIMETK
jgi:hypothetical protein